MVCCYCFLLTTAMYLVAICSLLCVLFIQKLLSLNALKLPLPPGPKPSCIPFIGNLFDIPSSFPWLTYDKWYKEFCELSLPGSILIMMTRNRIRARLCQCRRQSHRHSEQLWSCDGPFAQKICFVLKPVRILNLYDQVTDVHGRIRMPMMMELIQHDNFALLLHGERRAVPRPSWANTNLGDCWSADADTDHFLLTINRRRHCRLSHQAFNEIAMKRFQPQLTEAALRLLLRLVERPGNAVENIQ